ncbi:hypothetical protein M434DRAFT_296696 [Hypoxylon sp. CO27-5]|nr:hypothetical protein M434DRAFT_296696 [Hypoxylon sp. CO27-5]
MDQLRADPSTLEKGEATVDPGGTTSTSTTIEPLRGQPSIATLIGNINSVVLKARFRERRCQCTCHHRFSLLSQQDSGTINLAEGFSLSFTRNTERTNEDCQDCNCSSLSTSSKFEFRFPLQLWRKAYLGWLSYSRNGKLSGSLRPTSIVDDYAGIWWATEFANAEGLRKELCRESWALTDEDARGESLLEYYVGIRVSPQSLKASLEEQSRVIERTSSCV